MASKHKSNQGTDNSDEEESSLNVMSVQSDSQSDENKSKLEEEEDEEEKKRIEEEKKKRRAKHKKTRSSSRSKTLGQHKKLRSKFLKSLDKINLINKLEKVEQKKSEKLKTKESEKLPIDKSQLKYQQTNRMKDKTKPALYDKSTEQSISNILNRKSTPKQVKKVTSFTQKSYLDKSAAQLEADQTVQVKDQKPVVSHRISPEKMTNSLKLIVKHLYQNKKSLDTNQNKQEDTKSTIKFTLNSFINEDGERFD